MTDKPSPPANIIVMAEDDEDDRILTQEAIVAAGVNLHVDFVEDGEELLAYLRQEGAHAHRHSLPALVLLDLNMPRKSGDEVLQDIRSDVALRHLPVIVLSTSSREEDILRSYRSGANAFITKPPSFDAYVDIYRHLYAFWFWAVQLPTDGGDMP